MFISEIESQYEKALKSRPGRTWDWTHPERGPRGEPLRTLFHFEPGDPERLLVSVSGTHGPEAFIGSMIQTRLLSEMPSARGNTPSLLFVHNLNPFGSAWVRRANHRNIDLNRNSWRDAVPVSAGFSRYRGWLSSKSRAEFHVRMVPVLADLATRGLPKVSGAIAEGQSEFADSLFFTGRERSEEIANLRETLKEWRPRRVFVLDIHTGLGPPAHESLILESTAPASLGEVLARKYPRNLIDMTRRKGFYKAAGTLENLFHESFAGAEVCHLTQEFGTWNFIRVLRELVVENSMWHRGRRDDPRRLEHLLETFFPSRESWRRTLLESGTHRFHDLMSLI